jgi:Tol biopolymer transport system component
MQGDLADPLWSPNGKVLRFNVLGNGYGNTSVWEIPVAGGVPRALFPPGGHQWGGGWTPDAKYFLFDWAMNGMVDLWARPERSGFLHRQPMEPVRLTNGPMSFYSPIVSKDRKHIFAVGAQRLGELMCFNKASGKFLPYLNGISADQVAFSRDGQSVAYVSYAEGTLWRSKLDGSERVQLTFPPVRAIMPSWSPDGEWISYLGVEHLGGPFRIFILRASGGAPRAILDLPGNQSGTTWSPEGNAVMVAVNDVPQPENLLGIFRVDVKTGQRSRVPDSIKKGGPELSPDGRYLAALTGEDGHITLFDFETGKWAETKAKCANYPKWTADGNSIFYNTANIPGGFSCDPPGIYRLSVRDGTVENVVTFESFPITGSFGYWSGLAPNGSALVLHNLTRTDLCSLELQFP